jgi:hypothetical protein
MIKPLPSFEFLDHMFTISSQSPSGLFWKNSLSTKVKQGDVAGTKDKEGYWTVGITLNKTTKLFRVHRIVYALATNTNIDNEFVDHVDGNKSNNKISNLRLATNQQNCCNKQAQLKSTSAYKGVSWDKKCKKWRAQICINYKKIHLGTFEKETDAAIAYNQAAKKHHNSFAILNND